jgi:hypothetical protein
VKYDSRRPSFQYCGPQDAARRRVAGILFALLYGASLVPIRLSVPADLAAESGWLAANSGRDAPALNLTPFAGIAFLWFIGVIRDRKGSD